MRRSAIKLFLILLLALSGCTPPPSAVAPLNQMVTREERKLSINQFTSFKIKGGLAVKENNKGFSASLNWRQSSVNRFFIHIFGPLGSGNVKITGRAGQVVMRDGKKEAHAQSAERLMMQQTGYNVPFKHMYYWVRGLSAPNSSASSQYDEFKHLKVLIQDGWHIDYKRYTSYKGIDLPSKIFIRKGALKVKVVINKWSG